MEQQFQLVTSVCVLSVGVLNLGVRFWFQKNGDMEESIVYRKCRVRKGYSRKKRKYFFKERKKLRLIAAGKLSPPKVRNEAPASTCSPVEVDGEGGERGNRSCRPSKREEGVPAAANTSGTSPQKAPTPPPGCSSWPSNETENPTCNPQVPEPDSRVAQCSCEDQMEYVTEVPHLVTERSKHYDICIEVISNVELAKLCETRTVNERVCTFYMPGTHLLRKDAVPDINLNRSNRTAVTDNPVETSEVTVPDRIPDPYEQFGSNRTSVTDNPVETSDVTIPDDIPDPYSRFGSNRTAVMDNPVENPEGTIPEHRPDPYSQFGSNRTAVMDNPVETSEATVPEHIADPYSRFGSNRTAVIDNPVENPEGTIPEHRPDPYTQFGSNRTAVTDNPVETSEVTVPEHIADPYSRFGSNRTAVTDNPVENPEVTVPEHIPDPYSQFGMGEDTIMEEPLDLSVTAVPELSPLPCYQNGAEYTGVLLSEEWTMRPESYTYESLIEPNPVTDGQHKSQFSWSRRKNWTPVDNDGEAIRGSRDEVEFIVKTVGENGTEFKTIVSPKSNIRDSDLIRHIHHITQLFKSGW